MDGINIDNNCKNCGYDDWNFKVNVDKKRYKDLVMDCFGRIKNNFLRERLKELGKNFKGEVFLNHQHKQRFYNFPRNQDIDIHDVSPRFIAILFLLTADKSLWKSSEDKVSQGKCDLKQICLREIDTEGYALHQTAKTILIEKECIRINEVADRDLIDDFIFKAIINSALINRYGAELFLINK